MTTWVLRGKSSKTPKQLQFTQQQNFLFLEIRTRASSTLTPELNCFLCDLPAKSDNPLHLVQSFRLD